MDPRQMDPVKWTPNGPRQMDPVKWTPSSSRQRTESKPHIARHGHEARRDVHSTKLQALVYDILPLTTVVFSYAIGSRKLSANEQFFLGFFLVCGQTVVSLLQTTQIISDLFFFFFFLLTVLLTPAQIKPKSFETRRNYFFYPGWLLLLFT